MRPFTFKRNRVRRIYTGGKLIDQLQGASNAADGYLPEEWLASTVKACNDGSEDPLEGIGIALFEGEEIPFTELTAKCAEELFGKPHVAKHGAMPGFLTKLLDSAIRLPIQAHPDRQMAQELYSSKFGKTEAWIVLDGRHDGPEEPYVLFGFNEKLDEKVFREESLSGKMSKGLGMLKKHYVKPGDVLLIRGGVPHAIGPGNFIMEIMEPSDWVVQPEEFCGERKLTQADRFGKIDPKKVLDVFHFKDDEQDGAWLKPSEIDSGKGYTLNSLIDREKTSFFGAMKLDLSGEWTWNTHGAPFAVGAVTKGNCEISSEGKTLHLNGGDSLFIPASCQNASFKGDATIIFALPPV